MLFHHMETKEELLQKARKTIKDARNAITHEIHETEKTIERYKPLRGDQIDPFVKARLLAHFDERLDQLHHLFPNPFFFRGDVETQKGNQTLYFGKFHLIEKNVFSWTSPAARIRFAELGDISYELPNQEMWSGKLTRKDQFMIAGGEIRFMTTENTESGRTLVYQEQLSRRKTDFMLPEIIARMERAQDDVIRAHWKGSFLISGPAGSGKTTLAFHRIAYLLQSPEAAQHFSDENIIVFVQDESTKAYFSRLLPELGIHTVNVTTFASWAFEQLGIQGNFIRRQNGTDGKIDTYEYHKLLALQKEIPSHAKDPHSLLERMYKTTFTKEDLILFEEQKKAKAFDRFDLSILLKNAVKQKGNFFKEEIYYEQKRGFEVIRKKRKIPLKYSLIVVDEVQNYLPEQISILRSCIHKDTAAMLYVGDLKQQVMFGTLKEWKDVGESFEQERKVELEKVYRSTKQILTFISSLGYAVDVPRELREGAEVIEEIHQHISEEANRIKHISVNNDEKLQTGVIGFSEEYLETLKKEIGKIHNLHVLTVNQAQGVEFDRVFLVGLDEELFRGSTNSDEAYKNNIAHIRKDLLYVALTRAIDELFVFSKRPLKEIVNSISQN